MYMTLTDSDGFQSYNSSIKTDLSMVDLLLENRFQSYNSSIKTSHIS